MLFGRRPHLTVAEMFRGGLSVVAVPLLSGETPDEIQDTAQFYGFTDYGQGEGRTFEFAGDLHKELPFREDKIVVWAPRDGVCRIELHHGKSETRAIPRSAEAWRKMVARSPDRAWVLALEPTRVEGDRGVTWASLRRGEG